MYGRIQYLEPYFRAHGATPGVARSEHSWGACLGARARTWGWPRGRAASARGGGSVRQGAAVAGAYRFYQAEGLGGLLPNPPPEEQFEASSFLGEGLIGATEMHDPRNGHQGVRKYMQPHQSPIANLT